MTDSTIASFLFGPRDGADPEDVAFRFGVLAPEAEVVGLDDQVAYKLGFDRDVGGTMLAELLHRAGLLGMLLEDDGVSFLGTADVEVAEDDDRWAVMRPSPHEPPEVLACLAVRAPQVEAFVAEGRVGWWLTFTRPQAARLAAQLLPRLRLGGIVRQGDAFAVYPLKDGVPVPEAVDEVHADLAGAVEALDAGRKGART
jgi:hypothetical protein